MNNQTVGNVDDSQLNQVNCNYQNQNIKQNKVQGKIKNNRHNIKRASTPIKIIACVLIVFTTISNIVCLCRIFPTSLQFDFDYIGFIIGVLSLLVTILIGWQIYAVINIDKKIAKHIKDAKKRTTQDIKYNRNIFTLVCLAQTAKVLHHLDRYEESIPLMFNAISSIEISTAKQLKEEAYDFCINKLVEICPTVTKFKVPSEEEKDFFIRTALQTKKQEIIDFAFKIKVGNEVKKI